MILLGAGGAARAIAFLCVSKGAKEVVILNRTEESGSDCRGCKTAICSQRWNELSDYGKLTGENYVVIQTTSVGLFRIVMMQS